MSASSRFSKNRSPLTGRGNRLERVSKDRYKDLGADWDAIDPGFTARFEQYADRFAEKVRKRIAAAETTQGA